jgi:hypothetical protein
MLPPPINRYQKVHQVDIVADSPWQMSFGERAALEGLLIQLKPRLSIELGTAEGGSLDRIAFHSDEVHSFDLVAPQLSVAEASHVTIHTGDSHEMLPIQLDRFAEEGRNVAFALVDGDHSSAGVRQDIEDLLNSPAIGLTVILIHDTANPVVRAGLDAIRYTTWPKVVHVDLDFVAGYMFQEERLRYELWGGLGLILTDSSRATRESGESEPVIQERYYPAGPLYATLRDQLLIQESQQPPKDVELPSADICDSESSEQRMVALEAEVLRLTSVSAHHEGLWNDMMHSVSWKITSPLRWLARLVRT